MLRLLRTYKPLTFFGSLAILLFIVAAVLFIPVFWKFLEIHLVPNFPTLIVSGFAMLASLQALFTGIVLHSVSEKDRRDFEFKLTQVMSQFQDKKER